MGWTEIDDSDDDPPFFPSRTKYNSSTKMANRAEPGELSRKRKTKEIKDSPNLVKRTRSETPSPPAQPYVFRLAIDYGTTKIAASWDIHHQDATQRKGPFDIRFDNGEPQAPNIAAYHNGKFLWGRVVADSLEAHELSESQIIRFAKLAIFSVPETKSFQETVQKKLNAAGKTINDLVEDSLRSVIKFAKEKANKTWPGMLIDSMPMQLFVSVPQMWNPPANRIMTEAARRAGAPNCELVYEPECAAVHAIIEQMPPADPSSPLETLKIGDVILMADIGGGTADFVSYEILSNITDRGHVKLRTAQRPQGNLCGSYWVNQEFLKWLEHESEDSACFGEILTELGYERDDFLALASARFELAKVQFNDRTPTHTIFITGNEHHQTPYRAFSWESRLMIAFFNSIISKIEDAITSLLRQCPRVKVILLPGGFGHCLHLVKRLETLGGNQIKILQPSGSATPNPVPRGALLRHEVTIRTTASDFSWGTLIAEEWDPALHPDGILITSLLNESEEVPAKRERSRFVLDPDVVFKDPVHSDVQCVVEDRWNPLTMKTSKITTPFETEPQFRIYYPEVPLDGGAVSMSIDIYWSTRAKAAHSPGRKKFANEQTRLAAGPKDNLQDDVFHWDTVPIVVEDPIALGWAEGLDVEGKIVYEVHVCYALRFNGPNIEFVYDLRQRNLQPYDEFGEPRDVKTGEFKWEPEWKLPIWSASHNPFPKDIE